MGHLIIKEILMLAGVWLLGMVIFLLLGAEVLLMWLVYCILLCVLSVIGTVLFTFWVKKHPNMGGLLFAGISFFNQLLFLLLLFVFLEPQSRDHRILVMVGLTGYLLSFLISIRWKLRWIKNFEN